MDDFTFLTEKQCFGDSDLKTYFDIDTRLDIIKKRGRKATPTDFSILIGADALPQQFSRHIDTDDSLKGRTAFWWLKSVYGQENCPATIGDNGQIDWEYVRDRRRGARPALQLSSLDNIPTNGMPARKAKDGVLEVEYGYYPQTIVSETIKDMLDQEFKNGNLKETGNTYTVDSRKSNDFNEIFLEKKFKEYEFNGKRYVGVIANSGSGYTRQMSNGEDIINGKQYWVEVEPIKWLVDEKEKLMLTDKIMFSGIQFNHIDRYSDEREFDKTDICMFMNEYWAKEIEQNVRKEYRMGQETDVGKRNLPRRKSRLERMNPDETDPAFRRKMTDTEMIQSWIENGESVLLRGPSGIGKTERIREMYPDVIELKLTNNMLPEKVVGSTNIQTGEEIPPSYAKQIIMQGATEEEKKAIEENVQNIYKIADDIYEKAKESDKKQVVLLDELLNVNPHVQSLVYTLVLNRFIEIGEGIKLPKNVVIVATGNQQKYSSTAYSLAEPLEKRFDHILDMEPKVGEWITEYAIPKQVHPAVTGYIMSKYNKTGRSEEQKDIEYFYEEPEIGETHLDKYGQRGRTNDPRGWTAISKGLYNFEEELKSGKYEGIDVEDKLKRNLGTKLREEWAEEFYDFYNLPTLTPEEVVEGRYKEEDLPRGINEKFAYMTALMSANEEQVEECRKFVRRYCDPEYLSVYDIYWAGNDERKMEKLAELQSAEYGSYKVEDISQFAEQGAESYEKIGEEYQEYRESMMTHPKDYTWKEIEDLKKKSYEELTDEEKMTIEGYENQLGG